MENFLFVLEKAKQARNNVACKHAHALHYRDVRNAEYYMSICVQELCEEIKKELSSGTDKKKIFSLVDEANLGLETYHE